MPKRKSKRRLNKRKSRKAMPEIVREEHNAPTPENWMLIQDLQEGEEPSKANNYGYLRHRVLNQEEADAMTKWNPVPIELTDETDDAPRVLAPKKIRKKTMKTKFDKSKPEKN